MPDGESRKTWSIPAESAGWKGDGDLVFVFGRTRVEEIRFGPERLAPEDPRLSWFALRGSAADGGPFPPTFGYSPYDRHELPPPAPRGMPFGSPRSRGDGPAPFPATAPKRRTFHFARAHYDFFACGRTPVLHTLTEDGRVEWFDRDALLAEPGAEDLRGHPYPISLGRLLPSHRHGVVAGEVGFATVAEGRPVWVRASPFRTTEVLRSVAPCEGALGAPAGVGGDLFWPVMMDGAVVVAHRSDTETGEWSFRPVVGAHPDRSLGRPHALAPDTAVWVGPTGFLLCGAAGATWHPWRTGFRAATHLEPYVDVQGRVWQFGSTETGWAWAKVSSGGQDYAPVSGHQISGGDFTLQGADLCRQPTFDDTDRVFVHAFDGLFVVPVLAWSDASLIAVAPVPDVVSPDEILSDRRSALPGFEFRLFSRAGQAVFSLGAGVMPWSNRHDIRAFVYADHLFLTSSQDNRCVTIACRP